MLVLGGVLAVRAAKTSSVLGVVVLLALLGACAGVQRTQAKSGAASVQLF